MAGEYDPPVRSSAPVDDTTPAPATPVLGHAFEQLGAMRVEFKTDARNDRSRAALAGIGATFEGVFRRHQLMGGGRVRDSAWFAVVDEDWPLVRERLRARLAAQAGVAARAASR